jgi:biotin synthase
MPRHDWALPEVRTIHDSPLFDLVDRARGVHRAHQPPNEVQLCTLVSVKTGGCSEDCGYCAQSSHHRAIKSEAMLTLEEVIRLAREAKAAGATRLCMGTAWRGPKAGPAFDRVLSMVRGVKEVGLETCVTLGLLDETHATRLREAGLDSYNHNLDTSREYYPSVVTTHSFEDRLETLRRVREQGIQICSGGIVGMGETLDDRCRLLIELAAMDPHPDSVPINALVPVRGTPLGDRPPVDPLEVVRLVATARVMMPSARIRLSAGRKELTREAQLLAMYAGANSIFFGERLLTTENASEVSDTELLRAAGLHGQTPRPRDDRPEA